MTALDIVRHLQLQPHPEGGFYKEVYRSEGMIGKQCLPQNFSGGRHYATSIYYLLQAGDFSAFHRINSDEVWHYHAGGSLVLHLLFADGNHRSVTLGNALGEGAVFQAVMPAGVWFAAEPAPAADFVLAGCTVSPGFEYCDFELARKEKLAADFPQRKELIFRLCR